jgi:hypothetical protein
MGRQSHHGVPDVLRGPCAGRQTATTAPVVARHDALGTNHTQCWMCLHALRGMSRDWTAKPAGSYRFLDHGNHVSNSPWGPTVHGPPITPGTPRSRCDLTEPPPLSVRPSQHALALLRLPAFYGIGCIAHAALVQMLFTVITIPSIYTSVNQGSTDLSVRRGLAGLSAFPLQGVPYACPATSQTMADGPSRETRCRVSASCYQRGFAFHRVLAGPGQAARHRRRHGLRAGAAPLPRLSQPTWGDRRHRPAVPA